jgi:hypothetical protein
VPAQQNQNWLRTAKFDLRCQKNGNVELECSSLQYLAFVHDYFDDHYKFCWQRRSQVQDSERFEILFGSGCVVVDRGRFALRSTDR